MNTSLAQVAYELRAKGLSEFQTDLVINQITLNCLSYPSQGLPVMDDQALKEEAEKIKGLDYNQIFETYLS